MKFYLVYKMNRTSFNLQVSHFKHFLKVGQNSTLCSSRKCFSNSPLRYRTFNECDFSKRTSLTFSNLRYLNTSIGKFEKVTQIKTDEGKKGDLSIIYNGSLTPRVKGIKVFTCMTSLAGIFIQPWILPNFLNGKDIPLGIALLSCVGFFTFVTPFLCHLITKKYVTEIWYNSATDTYTATVLSFFLRKININFKIEDVTVPSIPPMFSTMYVKGKPLFIIVDCFLEIEHYIKMMGYDKPLSMTVGGAPNAIDKVKQNEKPKVM